jgi:hypothetical protein
LQFWFEELGGGLVYTEEELVLQAQTVRQLPTEHNFIVAIRLQRRRLQLVQGLV